MDPCEAPSVEQTHSPWKPGAATVFALREELYARGDFAHCPAEDIHHNIRLLVERIQRGPRRTPAGRSLAKDYYEGLYAQSPVD